MSEELDKLNIVAWLGNTLFEMRHRKDDLGKVRSDRSEYIWGGVGDADANSFGSGAVVLSK